MKKISLLCLTLTLFLSGCSITLPKLREEPSEELPSPIESETTPSQSPSETFDSNAYSDIENNLQQFIPPVEPSEDNKEMAAIAATIFTPSMSEYEKVKAIHDYLVIHVDYDYDNLVSDTLPDSAFTAEGALLLHSAVCEGYAKAFSYLCQEAGLEEVLLYGTADDGTGVQTHAWNQVLIDGEWYNIDVTWDDPLMNGKVITDGSNITYEYFLLPDDPFLNNHSPESASTMHSCTSERFLADNRRLTIEPYLIEPYTFTPATTDMQAAITQYLTDNILQFQLVCDTTLDTPESFADYALNQTKETMLTLSLYGQISVETQYGIADYAILSVTITP